ncbi:hypothetical protein ACFQT0_20605 [Hymenobacter humi]|uniref:Uncharacterized protein n=1 Tax=Hymenobacter humi TaxID=1411620 RepID=A0ABW2UAW1_9BACT
MKLATALLGLLLLSSGAQSTAPPRRAQLPNIRFRIPTCLSTSAWMTWWAA